MTYEQVFPSRKTLDEIARHWRVLICQVCEDALVLVTSGEAPICGTCSFRLRDRAMTFEDIKAWAMKGRFISVRKYYEFLVVERGFSPEQAEAIATGWHDESWKNWGKLQRQLKTCTQCGRRSFEEHPKPCPLKPVDGWASTAIFGP